MSKSVIFLAAVNTQANHEGTGRIWDALITFLGEHMGLFTLIFAIALGVICYRTYYKFKETYEINLLVQGIILIIISSIGAHYSSVAEFVLWLGALIALAAYNAPKCGVKSAVKGLLLAPIMIGYIVFILAIPVIIGSGFATMPSIIEDGLSRHK